MSRNVEEECEDENQIRQNGCESLMLTFPLRLCTLRGMLGEFSSSSDSCSESFFFSLSMTFDPLLALCWGKKQKFILKPSELFRELLNACIAQKIMSKSEGLVRQLFTVKNTQ